MLTKEERAWVKRLEKLLSECPERFGFYTVGDPCLGVFDRTKEHLFDLNTDLVDELYKHDADLCSITFPVNVHGVCG